MTGFQIVSLKDMIEELGESEVKSRLSAFYCPLNFDIEYFLKNKAIEFAKQQIAPTRLVFASYKGDLVLCGYFTIATKSFVVSKNNVSSNTFKRLKKFGTYDEVSKKCSIPAPLIAQLGKNFQNGYDKLISGDELLTLACNEVKKVQYIIGGKVVYIECEDKSRLLQFYERNGFKSFGKRNLDKDERDKLDGEYLVQMLKYLED
ncbi:MAG: N-acetyltransferase [Ruminiclostridium sp.]|nr:N-acetyltransferase [Ruminiclostridium sp.]